MTTLDLFPETQGQAISEHTEWTGELRDNYGHAITVLRLIPEWSARDGWTVGWFAQVGSAVDEWHPRNPDRHKQHPCYPWHRLDSMPTSKTLAIAAANATRAANIVLAQMLEYATSDAHAEEAKALQRAAEARARHWLCEAP